MIAFLAKQNLLILPERFPKYIPIISFREKFISFIKTIRLLMVSRKNLWAKKKKQEKRFQLVYRERNLIHKKLREKNKEKQSRHIHDISQ